MWRGGRGLKAAGAIAAGLLWLCVGAPSGLVAMALSPDLGGNRFPWLVANIAGLTSIVGATCLFVWAGWLFGWPRSGPGRLAIFAPLLVATTAFGSFLLFVEFAWSNALYNAMAICAVVTLPACVIAAPVLFGMVVRDRIEILQTERAAVE